MKILTGGQAGKQQSRSRVLRGEMYLLIRKVEMTDGKRAVGKGNLYEDERNKVKSV